MFLLYWDDSKPTPPEEMEAIMAAHNSVLHKAQQRKAYICSEALGGRAYATTVRIRDGQTLMTDGPYAETKEVVGGFYILDCRDIDEAIEYATQLPAAKYAGVEIRPVMFFPDWPYAVAADRKRHSMGT